MNYFSNIAKQSFKTSPTGERLFLNGFLSKPFIIPDEQTEQELFKKRLLLTRIFFVCMYAAIFLSMFFYDNNESRKIILIYIICSSILWYIVNYLTLRDNLQKLKRSDSRIKLKDYYKDHCTGISVKYSTFSMIFRFFLCLLFTIFFIKALTLETNIIEEDPIKFIFYLIGMLIFVVSGCFWLYSLYIKTRHN